MWWFTAKWRETSGESVRKSQMIMRKREKDEPKKRKGGIARAE
jgi:hypothetical protein